MYYGLIVPLVRRIQLATINTLIDLTMGYGVKTADETNKQWVAWEWLGFLYIDNLDFDHLSFLGIDIYDN